GCERGQEHVSEVTSYRRGLTRREVEVLKACFIRGSVQIVDTSIENHVGAENNSLQHLDGKAAGERLAPQGARPVDRLHVVDVGAIRRLLGTVSDIVCDLDGIPAKCRDLPDVKATTSVRGEVDPSAVPGEAGESTV